MDLTALMVQTTLMVQTVLTTQMEVLIYKQDNVWFCSHYRSNTDQHRKMNHLCMYFQEWELCSE
jgi:hypothetical protein